MIVICEKCGLKYKIDPTKIKSKRARFTCKGCDEVIILDKEELIQDNEIAALEDSLFSSTPTGEKLESTPETEELDDPDQNTSTEEAMQSIPRERSGLGLTGKVVLLMLLVSLLPGAIYFGLSFQQTNQRIKDDSNNYGLQISDILAKEVDEWVDKNTRILDAIANLSQMKGMNQWQQEELLKAVQKEYPWMYLVFTTDKKGINIARSDGKKLKDYSNRQYVKDVIDGKKLAWQNLIGKTSKKPALVLAVPITRDGETVGVLATAMTRDAISKLVTNWKQGETGSVFLVDQSDKVVAHQNNAFVVQQKDMSTNPLVQASRKDKKRSVEFQDVGGQEALGFTQKTKLGWLLAIQQDKDEAYSELKKAQQFAYTLLGITVIVIIFISLLASRAIVTPIKKLTDAANRISVGELDVEITSASSDEIGDLANAIIRMQDSLRLSIARLRKKRK